MCQDGINNAEMTDRLLRNYPRRRTPTERKKNAQFSTANNRILYIYIYAAFLDFMSAIQSKEKKLKNADRIGISRRKKYEVEEDLFASCNE